MAELKTKPTKASATAFLKAVKPEQKQKDSLVLLAMFEKATGEKPVMWGTSIVGFGMYHYESERSAQKGDWPLVGFSPRKQNITLYIMVGSKEDEKSQELLKKLGKYKASEGSCLYLNKLSDVDTKVLAQLIKLAYRRMKVMTKKKK